MTEATSLQNINEGLFSLALSCNMYVVAVNSMLHSSCCIGEFAWRAGMSLECVVKGVLTVHLSPALML